MHLSAFFETSLSTISIRLGALELFVEREPEWAPEGWLKVTRPGPGEMGLSLGRWAALGVNHRRTESPGLSASH
ncbi:MAG: hypothetical protein AAF550_00285 [Myxococcota bacterium]